MPHPWCGLTAPPDVANTRFARLSWISAHLTLFSLILTLGGCELNTGFHCTSNPQCIDKTGNQGVCEDTHYCSFTTDTATCPSGKKYGHLADKQSDQCVPSPCTAEQSQCGTTCVDLKTDATNCGVCGKICGNSGSCVAGVCSYSQAHVYIYFCPSCVQGDSEFALDAVLGSDGTYTNCNGVTAAQGCFDTGVIIPADGKAHKFSSCQNFCMSCQSGITIPAKSSFDSPIYYLPQIEFTCQQSCTIPSTCDPNASSADGGM